MILFSKEIENVIGFEEEEDEESEGGVDESLLDELDDELEDDALLDEPIEPPVSPLEEAFAVEAVDAEGEDHERLPEEEEEMEYDSFDDQDEL